jgi:hypothetical protein
MFSTKPPASENLQQEQFEVKLQLHAKYSVHHQFPQQASSIINSHNKHLLSKESKTQTSTKPKECNCRSKSTCPLDGKCLTEGVVYQATVKGENNVNDQTYIGISEDR